MLGFYTEKQVIKLTTLSRTTIWRRIQVGQFPRPVRLSVGRKAWPIEVVDGWLRDQRGVFNNAA